MPTQTNGKALEACIERHLTGGVSEDATGGMVGGDTAACQISKGAGYRRGRQADSNAEFAIDEAMFWRFLKTTQPAELAKLHHKADWKRQVVERLHRKLKKDGILAVRSKGLDVDNAHLTLFYRLSMTASSGFRVCLKKGRRRERAMARPPRPHFPG